MTFTLNNEAIPLETVLECLDISVEALNHRISKNVPLFYLGQEIEVVLEKERKKKTPIKKESDRFRKIFKSNVKYRDKEYRKNCFRISYLLDGEKISLNELAKTLGVAICTVRLNLKDVESCTINGSEIKTETTGIVLKTYDIKYNGEELKGLTVDEVTGLTGARKQSVNTIDMKPDWTTRDGLTMRRSMTEDLAKGLLRRMVEEHGKEKVMEYLKGLKC